MAANIAHFTATLNAQPSIFEVIAQNSLNKLLHPAFQKLATFLGELNPSKFGWLVEFNDELFLLLNGLVQVHYLRTTGASFAEYFYGLQRVSILNEKLTDAEQKLSLLFLVLLPYFKVKVDARIQLYKIENADNYLPSNTSTACKRAAIVLHSLFHCLYGFWTFVQYLRYLSNASCHQTPSLQLLRLKLAYALTPQLIPAFWTALFRGELSLSDFGTGLLRNTTTSVLELSAFFMQFLQVWNAERANYSFTSLPIVPPPPVHTKAGDFKGRCPICLQSYKIPTVLPVSGYVFCFPCIIRHLQKDPRCPVTQWPAKSLDVIRLYDSV
ncbi:hypothetical protein RI129_013084 [Pyrocoelia pectoralis]|uniref:Peroxisome assembly protein 12 n=1 Tax=Pyrocoelia pectoralis TaxID=417401 RepID=A0AAN7V7K3_9COLE